MEPSSVLWVQPSSKAGSRLPVRLARWYRAGAADPLEGKDQR